MVYLYAYNFTVTLTFEDIYVNYIMAADRISLDTTTTIGTCLISTFS